MQKIYFALGIHNHQPVGNFDSVFQTAYEKSYEPFLKAVLEHPSIKFSLHTSGCLLEWLEKHQRGYFDLVSMLIERGQVELLGGAFYEAILPILPREDALEQIRRMKQYLLKRFGVKARGAWLAERVWEPFLPAILTEAGVEYLPLDDEHFLAAGHSMSDLSGYYLTESNCGPVALFPIHQKLRYTIPFAEPEETIAYMKAQGIETQSPQSLFVMADDGEKFGLWPKTFEHVYTKRWLHRFFETLEKHADEIETVTFGTARDKIAPLGRTYLPTASYFEMSEWVLPPVAGAKFEAYIGEFKKRDDWENIRPFLKGGFWRGFLAKYPEVNTMHKKMLRVSKKFQSVSTRKRTSAMQTPLLRGQCNCPYWHGVFGGLYLPHLRHATWKELLLAEYTLDNNLHRGRKWVDVERVDHDADGADEILIENAYTNAYLKPENGGMLFEWDFKPRGYNLLNTLTRRPETYHGKLALVDEAVESGEESASIHDLVLSKEENLDKVLRTDSWPRLALLDHFPGWNSTREEFRDGTMANYGNFLLGSYQVAEMFTNGVRLERTGKVGETPVRIAKTITAVAGKPVLDVKYSIKNLAQHELHTPFGIEWNLALQAPRSHTHTLSLPGSEFVNRILSEEGEHHGVSEVKLVDGHEKVSARFLFDSPVKLWRMPIESVSLSEGGFERIFQSIALLFLHELHLGPGAEWRAGFSAYLSEV